MDTLREHIINESDTGKQINKMFGIQRFFGQRISTGEVEELS